jgi:hypothetical protein
MINRQRLLRYVSIFAVLLNVAAVGVHYYVTHKIAGLGVLARGAVIKPVIGVDSLGNYVTASAVSAYPCHVVRYTSIHCPSCRRDEPSWNHFDTILRNRGCDSSILAPAAADVPKLVTPLPNQRLLPVVPASVAQQTDLLATPSIIVLDHDWRVVWSTLGMLQPGDTERALSSLGE